MANVSDLIIWTRHIAGGLTKSSCFSRFKAMMMFHGSDEHQMMGSEQDDNVVRAWHWSEIDC